MQHFSEREAAVKNLIAELVLENDISVYKVVYEMLAVIDEVLVPTPMSTDEVKAELQKFRLLKADMYNTMLNLEELTEK